MSTRGSNWYVAWAQVVLVAGMMLFGIVFFLLGSGLGASAMPYMFIGATTSVVGAMIYANRPENAIGWLFLAVAASVGVAVAAAGYVDYSREAELTGFFPDAARWLAGGVEPVAFHSIVPLLLLFPTGRLLGGIWRVVGVVLLTAVLVALVTGALVPWPLGTYQNGPTIPGGIENPLAVGGSLGAALEFVHTLAFLTMGIGFVLAAVSVVFRYRSADSRQRQQIKWTAWAGVLVCLGVMAGNLLDVLGVSRWSDPGSIPILITLLAIALVPVATGIAILRYRLYDIDHIINRTLVYALLTATLALTYLSLVVGLQAVLRPVNGGSDLAIAVTTLVVAAMFMPARNRVQVVVDRRFNRRAYDASRTIEAFSATLRQEIDLDRLHAELLAVVHETMQPDGASLWLRERR